MPSRSQVRVAVDATGEIESAQDYYAYGEILRGYAAGSGNNDRYKFTEKERDAESEYDCFGARYYDSELGRWMSVDPLAGKYPGWSPYNYTLNNPLRFIDPKGMESEETDNEEENWLQKLMNLIGISSTNIRNQTPNPGNTVDLSAEALNKSKDNYDKNNPANYENVIANGLLVVGGALGYINYVEPTNIGIGNEAVKSGANIGGKFLIGADALFSFYEYNQGSISGTQLGVRQECK